MTPASVARRTEGAMTVTGAAANQRRNPRVERIRNLIRRDEMDVRIDGARGEDVPFAGEHFGRRADFEARGHAVHHPGIAGLANRRNAAVANADVGLVDAGCRRAR